MSITHRPDAASCKYSDDQLPTNPAAFCPPCVDERVKAANCGDTCCEPAGYSPVTVGDVLGHDDEDPSVTTWRTFGSRHIDNQPETVTAEAERIVYGGRGNDYGHPREDFTRTAVIWTGLLQHKLTDGEFITPEDVARLQIGLKLSRDIHAPKRDNRVDVAGYALCLDRLETGK